MCEEIDGLDVLLYDFSLQQDDVYSAFCSWSQYKVSIDTEILNNRERRVYNLDLPLVNPPLPPPYGRIDSWTEGIGSNYYGLLFPMGYLLESVGSCTIYYALICFHEKNELVWLNPYYKTCSPDISVSDTKVARADFYSISDRYMLLTSDSPVESLELYSLSGASVYKALLHGVTSYTFNKSEVARGVYTARIGLRNGGTVTKKVVVQ